MLKSRSTASGQGKAFRELTFQQVMRRDAKKGYPHRIFISPMPRYKPLLQAIAILLAILLLVSGEPMKGDECQLKRQEEVLDLEGAAGLYQVTLAMTAVNFTSEHKQSLMHTHLAMQAGIQQRLS